MSSGAESCSTGACTLLFLWINSGYWKSGKRWQSTALYPGSLGKNYFIQGLCKSFVTFGWERVGQEREASN